MTRARCTALAAATQAILVALAGCSGGGGGATTPRFAVGGVVSGLAGQGLVLRLNGGDALAIAANGPFAFPTRLPAGAAYSVSASAQPDGHLCTVASGSGTVSGADVTNVAVTCVVGRKLVASDGTPSASFGGSLAASSDGSTLVVGAHLAGGGAAYVYRWSGSGWDELKLTTADGAPDEWFGMSVATSADGGLVVVGAPGETVGLNARQGSARVFRWTGSSYVAEATLTASDGAAQANFGSSLALTSDGTTLVAGARYDDGPTTTDQGAAYVFRWNGSSFEEATKLTASDGATWDNLGTSVAVSADGNTVVAGAPYHDVGANGGQGTAYLYAWDGSTWNETQLTASNGSGGEYFGRAVGMSADGATVAAGMPFHSTIPTINHGSVYLYRDGGAG
ncbi:FG-GAP repeat protein [Anaeromyxobacter terrae]|uniref:FG-GAP repeat protein n=1 Tax=Anaeromyxobacter terrae TaxID=2925406 RepID=UPI001F58E8D4|nr:FG-GAP repeat protein [Anaeromyxobacter sp. SG22]